MLVLKRSVNDNAIDLYRDGQKVRIVLIEVLRNKAKIRFVAHESVKIFRKKLAVGNNIDVESSARMILVDIIGQRCTFGFKAPKDIAIWRESVESMAEHGMTLSMKLKDEIIISFD